MRSVFIRLVLILLALVSSFFFLSFLSRSFATAPFPFEPSFTHAHRGRDHVFYTRVRVRAFKLVCVQRFRGSPRSRSSHTCSFFPRDRFAPQPPRASWRSSVVSIRRSTYATPLHHARTGLVAMILYDLVQLSAPLRAALQRYESN